MSKKNKNPIFSFIEEKNPLKKAAFDEFVRLVKALESDFFETSKAPKLTYLEEIKHLEVRTGQSFIHWIVRYAQTIDVLHIQIFQFLKNFGFDLHAQDIEGQNLLHLAALKGFLLLTCWLIETEKLDIDLCSNAGIHPLTFVFLRKHYPESGIEIIPNNLADYYIQALPKFSKDKNSALIIAAQEGRDKIIEWLGKYRLNLTSNIENPNQDDKDHNHIHYKNALGFSAIDIAIIRQKNNALEALLNLGANPFRLTLEKTGLFHYLAEIGDFELFKKTYQKFTPNLNELIDINGNNLIHYATLSESLELVQFLAQNEFGLLTPEILTDGSLCGLTANNLKIIQWLVSEKGLVIYENTPEGKKPYVYDIENDLNILHSAICNDNLPALQWLIHTFQFNLNAPQKDGFNALHFSMMAPSLETAKWIHAQGEAKNLKNNKGQTALHSAILAEKFDHAKWLIDELGSNVFEKDYLGQNILHLISLKPFDDAANNFLNWLIHEKQALKNLSMDEKIQLIHQLAKSGFVDIVMDLLVNNQIQLLDKNTEGNNLFDTAVYAYQFSLIICLIEYIQNINKVSDSQKISIKSFNCFPDYLTVLASTTLPYSNISILKVNALDEEGEATIHDLIKYCSADFCISFLETFSHLKFDFNVKTKNGETPLALIIKYHDDETVKTFIQKYHPHITELNALKNDIYDLILQHQTERHELLEWLIETIEMKKISPSKQFSFMQQSHQKGFNRCFKIGIDFFIKNPKTFLHPLLLTIKNDDADMLRELLTSYDFNLQFRDEQKKDLLFIAAKTKKIACFNLLKELCLQSEQGIPILKTALKQKFLKFDDLYNETITNGHLVPLKVLLETGDFNWRTTSLFEDAFDKKFLTITKFLIKQFKLLPSDNKFLEHLIQNDYQKLKDYIQLWDEYPLEPEVIWLNNLIKLHPQGFSREQLFSHLIHTAPTILAQKILISLSNLETFTNKHQDTLLHLACHSQRIDLLPMLLKCHAIINQKNIFGRTALHTAVAFGFHEIVQQFIENPQVDLLTIDNNAQNLLHQAVLFGMSTLVISILKTAPHYIFSKDFFGNTPIKALLKAEFIFEEDMEKIQNMRQELIKNRFFQPANFLNNMELHTLTS